MGHVTRYSKSEEILENGESTVNHFEQVPENRTAVDNILRVNHGNQMRLGLMADAKANIMITVTSIVFSVTVANLDNAAIRWPLLGFAFGCFLALLFAIFAIIPNTHLDIHEYKEDYAKILMTDDNVYDSMAGDIFGQGKILALKKYKYLKWSYNSFLVGMSSAIIIFVVQNMI